MSSSAHFAGEDRTPAFQVNHRNPGGVTARTVDPNRMVQLHDNSVATLGSQKVAAAAATATGMSSSSQQQVQQMQENLSMKRAVRPPPTVLTLAGVRRLLCEVTSGGAFALDDIVVPDADGNVPAPPSSSSGATQRTTNARAVDLTVGQLLEGCEPGLRCALEMCWLRCGRDTRTFVTEVQSSSEAALLLRGRIHFGFEVSLDTMVHHLAPTLAVRLEMLPTAVYGTIIADRSSPHRLHNNQAQPAVTPVASGATPSDALLATGGTEAQCMSGKFLKSNGASPINNNSNGGGSSNGAASVPPPPPPPGAASTSGAAGRKKRGSAVATQQPVDDENSNNGVNAGNDDDDDVAGADEMNRSTHSVGNNTTTSSGGGSGTKSGLRRQREQHAPQEQQQTDDAALFSPQRHQRNQQLINSGANSNQGSCAGAPAGAVVGSAMPVGISRAVEDKVWLDTADLFCDAVTLMGPRNRAAVMRAVQHTMSKSAVMCDSYLLVTTGQRMMGMQQQQGPASGAAAASSSSSSAGTTGNNTQRQQQRQPAAAAMTMTRKASLVEDEDSCPGLPSAAESTHDASMNNVASTNSVERSARGTQRQQQQQQPMMAADLSATPFASAASVLQADTAAALAGRSGSIGVARGHDDDDVDGGQDGDDDDGFAAMSPNTQLRAILRAALTMADPLLAESARQALIDVLRCVCAGNNNISSNGGALASSTPSPSAASQPGAGAAASSTTVDATLRRLLRVPRWTDGIPHNGGSQVFIRELLVSEQRTPYVDYMGNGMQPHLTQDMRVVLVDWLHAICTRLNMSDATFHLNIALLDRVLALERDVSTRQLQLFGIAAMLIAAKYCEIVPATVSRFVFMSANAYSADDILRAERTIFNLLDAYVTMPSTLEAADLILAEQDPPATNEQRAYVHFLLHALLHFSPYGGQGRVIEAARAAVFMSRVEFGIDIASERMMAEQLEAAAATKARNNVAAAAAAAAAAAGGSSVSTTSSSSSSSSSSSTSSSPSSSSNISSVFLSQHNRSSSHLPHWHVDSCFLSEPEARTANEILDALAFLRDPAKRAGDLLQRFSHARVCNVAARPANVDLLRRKLATATADGVRFQALHVPRTPSSSTGSSPSSATRSLRGD